MAERRYYMDMNGCCIEEPQYNTEGMISPVLCRRCGQVYDLCNGKVVARYSDCTVYITPCCNIQVDDRTFTSLPAFERIEA